MKQNGYTLLEVLMATTVLVMGLSAIFGLSRSSLRISVDAAELAGAQLACQTTLNELLAQQALIAPASPKDIPSLSDWKVAVQVYDAPRPDMSVLHISAQKYMADGVTPFGIQYQLLRWVPQRRIQPTQTEDVIDPIDGFEDPLSL